METLESSHVLPLFDVERSKPSEHSPSAKSPEDAHELKLPPKDKVFKLYLKKEKLTDHDITKIEDLIATSPHTVQKKGSWPQGRRN